jgi:hypothetical protein
LVFAAEVLVDFAGFAAGAGFVSAAGAAAEFEPEAAGADAFSDLADAVDLLLLADFVEAVSFLAGALASAASPDDFADLLDFDFAVFEVLVPELASAEAFESSEAAFADFDFFALVDFVFASASFEALESSADAFVEFVFFAAVDLLEALEDFESASFAVEDEDFGFDAEDFPAVELSLLSVALVSVDFFFFVVFLAVVVLASLESAACAFTGAAVASPNPSPAEISNANIYFSNRFMVNPPQLIFEFSCALLLGLASETCCEALGLLQ